MDCIHLPQIVLFPIRGICGNGLRSLVRAAKEKNICLNIGIGNQRPVKTETNRRTAIDEFALVNVDTGCQVDGRRGDDVSMISGLFQRFRLLPGQEDLRVRGSVLERS